MLKIRFQRTGRKNDPSFRIVVGEHTKHPKSGSHAETVGSYHPKTKEAIIDAEAIKGWIAKGAQASGTVHNLLISKGIIEGKKINVLPKKTPIVKEEEAPKEEPKAEEKAEEKVEAPTEEEVVSDTETEEAPTAEAAPEEEKKEEAA